MALQVTMHTEFVRRNRHLTFHVSSIRCQYLSYTVI